MIKGGFSDSEIAGALKIGVSTVANYRGGNDVRNETIKGGRRSRKTDINGRSGDPHVNRDKKRKRKSKRDNQDVPTIGEGTTETTGDKGINFIGGKKSMPKENSEEEYECDQCHHIFTGQPKHCPGCGCEIEY